MVPNGWKQVRPSDIISIFNGFAFKSSDATNSGTKWLKIANVGIGEIKWDTQTFLPESYANEYNKFLLKKEDIVVALTRPTLDNKLKVARITTDEDVSLLNQRVGRIDCNNECDSNFIFQILQSREFAHRINIGLLGTDPPNLSKKIFEDFQILLPPLTEQQKIAKILTTWDKAIDTTERLIDNSKHQKKALMQQLLTGKKRLLDDNGKPFEDEWEEVQLADLGSTFNGLTGKTKVDFGYGEKYIPYMNIFKNTFIDSNELDFVNIQANEKQSTVQFGDIFFTTSSETPEEVGMSSVFISDTQENIYLNSFCFGFRLQSLEIVSPHFIGYILRSSKIRRKISVLAQGSTRFNISKRQLVKTAIPLPSLKEQQKIAAVLTTADKEIELLEQQLADLQQEKKALMQVLLTGKKRVRLND